MKITVLIGIILAVLVAEIERGYGQVWTSNGIANVYGWNSIAVSADGTKMVVAGAPNSSIPTNSGIYISTNSGVTWLSASAPVQDWNSIACSADGMKLVAAGQPQATNPAVIYTSADGGASWVSNSFLNFNNFVSVASSSDGSRLVAVGGGNPYLFGPIHISTNSGESWVQTSAPITNWCSVASSADGSTVLAGTLGESVSLSRNSGTTWTFQTNLPAARWTSVAVSADGRILMAAAYQVGSGYGRIYVSTNSGAVWTQIHAPTNQYWPAFCSSADGTELVAVSYTGFFYSTNSGNTWMSNNAPFLSSKVVCIASSADGNKLVVGANGPTGGIYTTYSAPSPQMDLTLTNRNLFLSWLVPSTNFALQENSDLTTTDWVTLTNTPTLNLSNLNDEVVLSPSNRSGFFRLMSQ